MKKLLSSVLIATSVALLSACSPDDNNKVKVAINTGPDEAIWKVVEQVAKINITSTLRLSLSMIMSCRMKR